MSKLLPFFSAPAFSIAAGCFIFGNTFPVALGANGTGGEQGMVSYNYTVRPILAAKCFSCHAVDPKNRQGKLRLDVPDGPEGAVSKGAFVPGKPAESELLKRVSSKDPEEVMPPPEKHNAVTAEEAGILHQWILQGARYEPHWAFSAPQQPTKEAPVSIDAAIEAKLAKEGIPLAGQASPEEWLRRVTLALTGVTPSLAEVDAFLAAPHASAAAREQVVEKLLASPRYGERQAAVWLDAARYADTYGRHEDMDNTMWPWREWVIRAFNENLPYDQFLTWQMAGDLLPNATQDQRLATGFHRLAVMTNEAGADPEENRWMQVFDRVKTTSTAVLGLTLECSQCHDHKYDPFSMKEYYQLAAFFDKGDEFGLFPRYCNGTPPPAALLYASGQAEEHQRLQAAVVAAEQRLEQAKVAAKQRFAGWLKHHAPPGQGVGLWTALAVKQGLERPAALMVEPQFYLGFDSINQKEQQFRIANAQELMVTGHVPKKNRMPGTIGFACEFPEGKATRYRLPPQLAHFRRAHTFSFSLWLKTEPTPERGVILHRCRAGLDATHRGYELMFLDGKLTASLCHYFPGNAIRIQANEKVDFSQKWRHIGLTYDGSSRAGGLKLFVDGAPLATTVVRDQLTRDIDYLAEWKDVISNQVADGADRIAALTLGGRVLDTGLNNAGIDELRGYDKELSPVEMAYLAGNNLKEKQNDEAWFAWYAREVDRGVKEAQVDLNAARDAENAFNIQLKEVMVMEDSSQAARKTTMLLRGNPTQPSEVVEPDVPAALGKMASGMPKNRLGLAQWLTRPDHPLTARVQVNRLWMLFFGRGLVPTPEDYGLQGQVPSNPVLLDHLATKFISSGWDIKALCREIALSQAFARSSLPPDGEKAGENGAKDLENRFLGRGPRLRLSAEQIRDSALAASGLLVGKIGGASVKPYQPAGLWEDSGTQHTYEQDTGEALYRRSLYTFWRRTCPPPLLSVFDAPTREFCLVEREPTMTPLQSLAMLNEPGLLETARVIAEGLVSEFPKPEMGPLRVQKAFKQLTSKTPSAKQAQALIELLAESLVNYTADPAAAQQLLKYAGEAPLNAVLPPNEVAATLLVVRAIFNTEPFLVSY